MAARSAEGRGRGLVPWLLTAGSLLAIPLYGLSMTRPAVERFAANWLHALTVQFGAMPADRLDAVRLPVVCADPALKVTIADWCGDFGLATTFETLAFVTLGVAIALIAILVVARVASVRLGRRLGWVFGPGLYLVLFGIAAFTLVGSIVIVGGMYVSQVSVSGGFSPYSIILGAIFGVGLTIGSLRAIAAVSTRIPVAVSAMTVDRASEPRLFERVDKVAAKVGTRPPDNVLVGLIPTFWVTDLPVRSPSETLTGRTMYMSLPLCRVLDTDEFDAVMAHELAHYQGGDTLLTRKFYPIYVGTRNALEVFMTSRGGITGMPSILSATALALFLESFTLAERRLSRSRELEADRVARAVTSPLALGSALVKVSRYSSAWDVVTAAAVRGLRWGVRPDNLSVEFGALAKPGRRLGDQEQEHARGTEHPTDSHPPVSVRLDRLGRQRAAVARARAMPPMHPAIELLANPETLEMRLVGRWVDMITPQLGAEASGETEAPASRPARTLRAAAIADPFIARVVDRVEDRWGRDLVRPFVPRGEWVALTDLEIAPEGHLEDVTLLGGAGPMPGRAPVRVTGLAGRSSRGGRCIPAQSRLQPIGYSRSNGARPRDLYLFDGRCVVVQAVGDSAIEEQLAGLFLVPAADPVGAELSTAVASLEGHRPVGAGARGTRRCSGAGRRPKRAGRRKHPRANAQGSAVGAPG